MTTEVHGQLAAHLIRADGQEDLSFALWNPSVGAERTTALLKSVILPEKGEREVHGNVSFLPSYLERVCELAMKEGMGIAFLHSHPFTGWQGMSHDDVVAEQRIASPALALTGQPLIGLTLGCDGVWSARAWMEDVDRGRDMRRQWCSAVRVVGEQLNVSFYEDLRPRPRYREMFKRTFATWGADAHAQLARVRIGVVGLGSVGALVAESLARMGCEDVVFIDFDAVELHNLDRLVTATDSDIGELKVRVADERARAVATAADLRVRPVAYSVVEKAGYEAALDCDVLFSCVDRPRARHILNHFAYAHLIPVIDGGISVRFRDGQFRGVDWQVQTVAPGRPCLECLGAYDPADVSTEAAGKLDDPSYLSGLPVDHRFRRNENVFPFSMNLASLEILQLVALVTGAAGIFDFGAQRHRYVPGIMEQLPSSNCRHDCEFAAAVAIGDRYFSLSGSDIAAARARQRRRELARAGTSKPPRESGHHLLQTGVTVAGGQDEARRDKRDLLP